MNVILDDRDDSVLALADYLEKHGSQAEAEELRELTLPYDPGWHSEHKFGINARILVGCIGAIALIGDDHGQGVGGGRRRVGNGPGRVGC